MTVKIRPMSAADKPALMQILKNTPEFKPYEVTVAEELVDYFLSDGIKSGYNIQIADDDGEVAGYVCFGETPCTVGTWDIYWIAVSQTRRGKGIGLGMINSSCKRSYNGVVEESSKALSGIFLDT
jgi:ribosomal protein S18 acetylase RimI-like enzyme